MPYVTSSGEITDKQPWGLSKITAFFFGILNFFFMFFRTLISPGTHSRGDRYTQDFRPSGGGPPPRPPRMPRLRRFRPSTSSTCPGGSCRFG